MDDDSGRSLRAYRQLEPRRAATLAIPEHLELTPRCDEESFVSRVAMDNWGTDSRSDSPAVGETEIETSPARFPAGSSLAMPRTGSCHDSPRNVQSGGSEIGSS